MNGYYNAEIGPVALFPFVLAEPSASFLIPCPRTLALGQLSLAYCIQFTNNYFLLQQKKKKKLSACIFAIGSRKPIKRTRASASQKVGDLDAAEP